MNKWVDDYSSGNKELNIDEIKPVIIELCLNKDGSRIIQDIIGTGTQ